MSTPTKKTQPKAVKVSDVVVSFLNNVSAAVQSQVPPGPWSAPGGSNAVHVPNMDALVAAAKELDTDTDQATRMLMILRLLRRAHNYGNAIPDPATPLAFPADHHFHPTFGREWYYVGAKFPVKDASGATGEAALLYALLRTRAVGMGDQSAAMWTNEQATLMTSTATLTIRMMDGKKVSRTVFVRRNRNCRWGAVQPTEISYSKPGEKFALRVGDDSIMSTQDATATDIVPLDITIADGTNLAVQFSVAKRTGVSAQRGWFLQGMPASAPGGGMIGAPGSGFTTDPTPGFYYSWPQLVVPQSGASIVANGETFTVTGAGSAWIDHQQLTQSLNNAVEMGPGGKPVIDPTTGKPKCAVQPIPFVEDPNPNNGWAWQFCNCYDGKTAYTGSTFVQGSPMLASTNVQPYGYKITLNSKGCWTGAFYMGAVLQPPATLVLAPAGATATDKNGDAAPYVSHVLVPNDRVFLSAIKSDGKVSTLKHIISIIFGKSNPLRNAQGWKDATGATMSATFNNPDFSLCAEAPATFSGLLAPIGWGYLESVGFEPTACETARLLHYLEVGIPATLALVETTKA